jgi:choice-of-anchor B domain-containing protein
LLRIVARPVVLGVAVKGGIVLRLARRSRSVSLIIFSTVLLIGTVWNYQPAATDEEVVRDTPDRTTRSLVTDRKPAEDLSPMGFTPCEDGFAGEYPCKDVDLMSMLPLSTFGASSAADIWGWTDRSSGKEYALITLNNGTAFVDISDPANPIYVGKLPSHVSSALWRDVEVYKDHAFVVADAISNHGMQVFDLRRLRNVPNPPVTFTEDAHYNQVGNVHTIGINTRTGFANLVGSNTCLGGLHLVDVRRPTQPKFAGCFDDDGYVHEAQCVVYRGPDADHRNKEICFAANEDTLTIVDVTNKSNPQMLSRTPYTGSGYTHQGWLMAGQGTFVVNDELDEINQGHNTKTRFFNVEDLEAPFVESTYIGPTKAIDHNLYVHRGHIYEGNYQAGLRILDLTPTEVAFFDIYPSGNSATFNGMWGNYPFFRSGIVVGSGIGQGLFVMRPNL